MDTKYLLQKGNRWYVRVAIPRPLWAQYTGKWHILKSLKTGDLKTAQRRRHTAVAAIKSGLEAEVSKYRKATRLVEQGVHTPGELIQATRMMVDDEGINIGHYTDWIWNLLEERFGLSENDGRPVLPPDWQPAISAGARAGQGYSRTPRQRCPGGLSEGQAARQGVHPQDKGTLCAEVPGLDGGGDVELASITRDLANRYVTDEVTYRVKSNGSPVSMTTKKNEVSYLVNFFRRPSLVTSIHA